MNPNYTLARLDADTADLFFAFHDNPSVCSGCYCVAWYGNSWAEWESSDAEQNLRLRRELIARGEHDGYLLLEDDEPIAWCQVGPRDRLPKLVNHYKLEPDPHAFAITCFTVLPERRGQGHADRLLKLVVDDVERRDECEVLEAFPRRGVTEAPGDVWTGPESLYIKNGFRVERDDDVWPVLRRAVHATPSHE